MIETYFAMKVWGEVVVAGFIFLLILIAMISSVVHSIKDRRKREAQMRKPPVKREEMMNNEH
jgi:choline-glycine betaine transporter